MKQATPIIEKIATAKRRNSAFAYYRPEDIEQEVWILALEALPRYIPSAGELENFLNNHVTNRLKNLKRDKYYRPDPNATETSPSRIKMNLINALPLGGGDIAESGKVLCSPTLSPDPLDVVIFEEFKDYIVERLPYHLQNPFYSIVHGNPVRKPAREELQKAVKKILEEKPSNG